MLGASTVLSSFGLALLLGLALQDPLILSQHTHIPQPSSEGRRVEPLSGQEQLRYTRSLRFPRWFAQWVLINFNAHELHHLDASVPGYRLPRLAHAQLNEVHWWTWLQAAKRLSTAFDSVTLYGHDPDPRPDIYGKVGNSGVSIATLDDMKVLYGGFDLCNPSTSVSMTINGPAPSILAMFMNTAIDQNLDKFKADNGREPTDTEAAKIREWVLANVRGTVQADILKEDQGQNTCIFSTEFSLKVMGDIAQYFVHHNVRNFYSVSISGYHIAEAGANPISQLAFTLSNGFTFV